MSSSEQVTDDLVHRIHEEAVVVDSHVDTTMRLDEPWFDFMDRNGDGHIDYPRLREGGVNGLVMAVYMGKQDEGCSARAVSLALKRIDSIRSLAEKYPDRLEIALTGDDVRRIAAEGRIAFLIGIEGGHIIDNSVEVLRCYQRLGARVMTLTHSFHHDWADSSGLETRLPERLGGLSPFGRDVVGEMNRLGMVIDISHVSDGTFNDVLDLSEAPVAATHSGCRALYDHPRNLSDDMIKRLAARGGVVQIVFYSGFLDPTFPEKERPRKEKREQLRKRATEKYGKGTPEERRELRRIWQEHPVDTTPLDLLLDHIDHVIALVGADHVGLGSDWDGIPVTADQVNDCSMLRNVTGGLLRRGHSGETVKKVLGGNFLRLMDEVAATADDASCRAGG